MESPMRVVEDAEAVSYHLLQDSDDSRLNQLGYKQELSRTLALTRLGVLKQTYDCDSDSEGYVEDLVDDELYYASGDTPKLQFRKEASRARWIEELGMAEVVEKKGRMWTTTGIVRGGKTYCSIEETLFLAEIGALEVLHDNDAPLSLSDMYGKVAEDNSNYGCSWESFEVYRCLKFLGYIVGHHQIPWSLKNIHTNISAQEGMVEFDRTRDKGSVGSSFIAEIFSHLKFSEIRPMFDVYPPNSKFKKSSPSGPCFVLCLIRGHPPSKQQIKNLETHCRGSPLKFCTVEHGRVSFISFTKTELPVLP